MSGVACHHRLWTSRHTQTASGVACYHCSWTGNMVERCRAWHAINALGQNTRKNDVGRGMTSSPLGSTHGGTTSGVACNHRLWAALYGRTTSGVACHHHLWAAYTVERRRAWHAIIDLRQHTQSKDVGRGMISPPLNSTHDRTTSGVTCHHRHRTAHDRTTSGMA